MYYRLYCLVYHLFFGGVLPVFAIWAALPNLIIAGLSWPIIFLVGAWLSPHRPDNIDPFFKDDAQ